MFVRYSQMVYSAKDLATVTLNTKNKKSENCFFLIAKVENILSLLKEEESPGPKFWT